MAGQQSKQDRREGLRVPVYLDATFELSSGAVLKCKVLNLATEGVGIKTTDPVSTNEKVILEFLIPGTLTSIRTAGEVLWCRSHPQEHRPNNPSYIAGIKFKDLAKDCQIQLLEYILREVLCNEDLLELNGIAQVMSHIRHMPPTHRLKYYRILTNRRIAS
jgi:hypothetical protein